MESQRRKENIRARLKRGDLKKLSEELDMSYSYLSQAFSPGSKFTFTDELARKVEEKMGWPDGALDEGQESHPSESINPMLIMANKFRAKELALFYGSKIIRAPYTVTTGYLTKTADIAIHNDEMTAYAIGKQCQQINNEESVEELVVLMAMTGALYGFLYSPSSGIDPAKQDTNRYFDEKRESRWFKYSAGKVVEIKKGPDNVFEHVGI